MKKFADALQLFAAALLIVVATVFLAYLTADLLDLVEFQITEIEPDSPTAVLLFASVLLMGIALVTSALEGEG